MPKVLITGATSGIGEQLAIRYANQMWEVVACGRNQQKLQQLSELSPLIRTSAFDVTDAEQVAMAASELTNDLDLVILNAGNCEYIDDPMAFDSALFQRVIDVNLVSIAHCLEHILPKMIKGSTLVLMSSSAAYLPLPRATAYGASKAALNYLTKTLAIELHKFGIGVSLICPGFVKTPLTEKNDFAMPMQVSAELAARIIYFDLQLGRREIHFPYIFTFIMKCFAALPDSWWKRLLTLPSK